MGWYGEQRSLKLDELFRGLALGVCALDRTHGIWTSITPVPTPRADALRSIESNGPGSAV